MAKSAGQKLKLLYIIKLLTEKTDENHPATTAEIISYLEANGIHSERKSIYDDIELTGLLEKEFDNYHFEEEIVDGDIEFTYKLQPGKASTRNAIKLLEVLGYEKEIIEKALKRAEDFMNTGEWKR